MARFCGLAAPQPSFGLNFLVHCDRRRRAAFGHRALAAIARNLTGGALGGFDDPVDDVLAGFRQDLQLRRFTFIASSKA